MAPEADIRLPSAAPNLVDVEARESMNQWTMLLISTFGILGVNLDVYSPSVRSSLDTMKLLDLPPELLHAILTEAVLLRGLQRAMRMRLVNKQFSRDVLQVVFETHLPDTRNGYRIRKEVLWNSYISHRVWTNCDNAPSLFLAIRRTAETLCQKSEVSDEMTLRAYIDDLCCLANHVLYHGRMLGRGIVTTRRSTFEVYIQDDFDSQANWAKHMLVAAAYLNDKMTVRSILDEGCDPSEPSDIFGTAIRAAAVQGHNEIVETLLSWMLGREQFIRARCAAIRGATQGGHLDTLNLVLDSRWGPISPSEKLYANALRNGLRTKNPDVFDRIAWLTRLQKNGSPEICLTALLAQAAGSGNLQMVHHLLKQGAFANGDAMNLPANPLRNASLKGHTEIVKLLLECGARPRFGWGDTLTSAAKSGYLDIVRILLKHGADVNESPAEDLRAPPAIVSAIQLEHEQMFSFLKKKGATLKTLETGGRALEIAVEQGLESMVNLLIRERVEVNDAHVDIAIKHGRAEIARTLRQYMDMPSKESYADWALRKVYMAFSMTT